MQESKDKIQQRFSLKGGYYGLARDTSWQMTIFIVIAIVNWILFLYAFSELGSRDTQGAFQLSFKTPPIAFYIFAGGTFISCLGSAFLIRSKDSEVLWSSRFFASGLPAAIIGYFVYSTLQ